jgi:hypothetical protein
MEEGGGRLRQEVDCSKQRNNKELVTGARRIRKGGEKG